MIGVNSEGTAFSAAFEAAMSSIADFSGAFDMKLVALDGTPIDCTIMRAQLMLGAAANGSSGLPLGQVLSSSLTATLAECSETLAGEELRVQVGIPVAGGALEYATVARVVVTGARRTRGTVAVTAVGIVTAHMGVALGLDKGSYSASAVASAVAAATGYPVYIGGFQSVDQTVHIDGDETCRQALASTAMRLGGFAAETYDGGVLIAPIPTSATWEPGAGAMTADPSVDEGDYELDGLTVTVPQPDDEEGEAVADVVYEYGTGRVQVTDENATGPIAARIWANCGGRRWRPGTATFGVLDPRLTPFDMLEVAFDGETLDMPCWGIGATYDGGWFGTVTAGGLTEAAEGSDSTGPTTKLASSAAAAASAPLEEGAELNAFKVVAGG